MKNTNRIEVEFEHPTIFLQSKVNPVEYLWRPQGLVATITSTS